MFSKEVEIAATMHQKLGFGIGLFQGGTNLFLNGIVLGTLYMGGHLLSVGQLTPGDLMAFLMATQTIQRSLTQLSLLFGNYVRGISAGGRVFEVNSNEFFTLHSSILYSHFYLLVSRSSRFSADERWRYNHG